MLDLSTTMYPDANPRRPAIQGGTPAFLPNNPVPQIFPSGYGRVGEHSAVDSILRNEAHPEPLRLSSKQRYISK